MEKSKLTEVKAILKSLVLSCPDKITIEQLNRDYRDVEGTFIPFRQLGYGDIEQFLRSVPDTLRVFGSGPSAMVCFVSNEKSDHIHAMIMKQNKSKSRARSRPKRAALSRNNAFQGNSSVIPFTKRGQQLSPYQSVNRNHVAKTLQVRPSPQVPQRSNCGLMPLENQVYLAQPNAPLINPILSTIQKGVIKTLDTHVYQNQVNHVANLLKSQCNVRKLPPPPLPRHQNNIYFPSEKKSFVQVEAEVKQRSLQKFNEIDSSTENTSFIQIKPPTAKKQLSIKFSEDVQDIMPALSKVLNPIKEPSKHFSVEELKSANNSESSETKTSIKQKPRGFFDDSTENVQDPDEAIPSFAAKNNVFRLDFPEYTIPYGNKIAPYELLDGIIVGTFLKIFVTEIHSPFKFWFHIFKTDHEVDVLMYQMERYYSRLDSEDLRIPTACLAAGQVCAACYKGLWHRAEIVSPPVNKHVKVSFMDYGTVSEVEIANVKFLTTFFGELPAQAIRGCLSNIKPCQYHWSHESTKYFLNLVTELMLYAKITEIDEQNRILYMILCDTNGDSVVQVNSSLVENGYALYNEDWKTERIKQYNGKRLHHPCEDFPTFSMIESGEYPTFDELVSLQERGINYEFIYDLVIFNQSTILNKHESVSEKLRSLPYFLTTSNPFLTEILLQLNATTSKAM